MYFCQSSTECIFNAFCILHSHCICMMCMYNIKAIPSDDNCVYT